MRDDGARTGRRHDPLAAGLLIGMLAGAAAGALAAVADAGPAAGQPALALYVALAAGAIAGVAAGSLLAARRDRRDGPAPLLPRARPGRERDVDLAAEARLCGYDPLPADAEHPPGPAYRAMGWYADPDAPERMRLWDGEAWTTHRWTPAVRVTPVAHAGPGGARSSRADGGRSRHRPSLRRRGRSHPRPAS
jgi:uncharacterized protein DUF2510